MHVSVAFLSLLEYVRYILTAEKEKIGFIPRTVNVPPPHPLSATYCGNFDVCGERVHPEMTVYGNTVYLVYTHSVLCLKREFVVSAKDFRHHVKVEYGSAFILQ